MPHSWPDCTSGTSSLKRFQRFQRAFVDHHIVAQQAHTSGPAGDTFGDQTTRNLADAGDLEDLFDLGVADEVLANFGDSRPEAAAFTSSTRS